MTINEKLLLEMPSPIIESAVIHLFKEGLFYVAYNESAVLFKKHYWPELKIMRIRKKNGESYLRAGFPIDSSHASSLISRVDGEWPVTAKLSVSAGLGLDFDLNNYVADKDIQRFSDSASVAEADSNESIILAELATVDPLSITPLDALKLINRWRGLL
ncbi:MAG: hypothetical protein ACI3ZY_00565 [Parabacteroides sp.]